MTALASPAPARVLVVGPVDRLPLQAAEACLRRAGCSVQRVERVQVDPSVVEGCDALVLDAGSERDPVALVAQLWCLRQNLPTVLLMGAADHALRDAALKAGVFVVPFDHVEAALPWVLAAGLDQDRVGIADFTRQLARSLCTLAALSSDARDHSFLQAALDELAGLFDAKPASILLFSDPADAPARPDDVMRMVASIGHRDEVVRETAVHRGEGVAGRVAQSGIPQLLLRSVSANRGFDDLSPRRTYAASLAVPIRVRAADGTPRVLGVLNLARQQPGEVFTPRDLDICDAVAAHLGDALARLDVEQRRREMSEHMAAVEKLSYAGELAAGIAHEVANPIGYVRANLEALEGYLRELAPVFSALQRGEAPLLDGAAKEVLFDLPGLVAECRDGVERAQRIVAQTKDMVRLDGDSAAVEAVPLKELVDGVVKLVRARIGQKAKVRIDVPADVVVVGRPIELHQVIVNLVVNAADACGERAATDAPGYAGIVRVRAAACGRHAVLVVEDNGVGIAADKLERVFAPLYTTKPRGVGTGLGLGVVRRIVEGHGGRIDLASQPGQGTAFSIRLPALEPARPHAGERARPFDAADQPAGVA